MSETTVEASTDTKPKRVRKSRAKAGEVATEAAPAPVEVTQVNPGLWQTAMELSGRDRSKITVLAHNKVLVQTSG